MENSQQTIPGTAEGGTSQTMLDQRTVFVRSALKPGDTIFAARKEWLQNG